MRHAGRAEVALEQARHRDVLREDEDRTVLGDDRADELVEQLELLRAAAQLGVGLAQVVGRVVADLLEPGQQLEHQAAARLLVGLLDAAHATRARASRRARPARGSARAGGRSRSSAAARARCRGRTCGGAAGTGRSGRRTVAPWSGSRPDSIGPAHTLRKALRLPSRPGIAQSRIDHSSVRSFSTGVPVSATRAALGMVRSARAAADCEFLTCWASSATTRSHGTSASAPRRCASCRRSSARTPLTAGRGRASAAVAVAAHGHPQARSEPPISASQLPSSEAGQTTSVGGPRSSRHPAGAGAARSADRLAEPHVVGQAGAEAERR